jgi:hypothetical protein
MASVHDAHHHCMTLNCAGCLLSSQFVHKEQGLSMQSSARFCQTCGRKPSRNRSPTKPPERAPPSYGAKHGKVLPLDMRGTRRPSSVCSHQGGQQIGLLPARRWSHACSRDLPASSTTLYAHANANPDAVGVGNASANDLLLHGHGRLACAIYMATCRA